MTDKNQIYMSEIYQRVEDLDKSKIRQMELSVKQDKLYYPSYHISPKYGLLNDPNGLIFHNGKYHIFYQYCPNGPFHGLKSWYLVTTPDFINYTDHGVILSSQEKEENYGIYSGSAVVIDNHINLIYTANHRDTDDNYKRKPYQLIAILDDDYNIISKRIAMEPDFNLHTEHFRDPVPIGNNRLLIGAQDNKLEGRLAITEFTNPNYTGEYQTSYLKTCWSLDPYMIECPNYFKIGQSHLLLFSPQGVNQEGNNFNNVHDVVYSISDSDLSISNEWNSELIEQVDYGFDFYAPQVLNDDKRKIMIGWLGLPDTIYPTDEQYQWSQMLTIPRQLEIVNNKLVQRPIDEIYHLFKHYHIHETNFDLQSRAFHLKFTAENDFVMQLGTAQHYLEFGMCNNEIYLDRIMCDLQLSDKFGTKRSCQLTSKSCQVEMFVDNSAIEIFVNNGTITMTARFYLEQLKHVYFDNLEQVSISYTNGIKMKENNE